MIEIEESQKQAVQQQERRLISVRQSAANAAENSAAIRQKLDHPEKPLKFRDRYLGGYFGGNRDQVKQRRALQELVKKFDRAARAQQREASHIDREINKNLHGYLAQNDPEFQAMLEPWLATKAFRRAVDDFTASIETALKEIHKEQNHEDFDFVSHNTGHAVIPSMETGNVDDALYHVRNAAPAFQKAVAQYKATLGTPEKYDLDFDLETDRFDFMGALGHYELEDAKASLKEVLEKAARAGLVASHHYKKADRLVFDYINQARQACKPIF